jgi:hypothetical protein
MGEYPQPIWRQEKSISFPVNENQDSTNIHETLTGMKAECDNHQLCLT